MKKIYYLTASKRRLLFLKYYLEQKDFQIYPNPENWKKDFNSIKELTVKTVFHNKEDVDRDIMKMDHKNIFVPKLHEVSRIFKEIQPDLYIIDLRLLPGIGYWGQHFYSCIRRAHYDYVLPTLENKDPVIYLKQFDLDPPPYKHRKMRYISMERGDTLVILGEKIIRKIDELFKRHTWLHRLLHSS